MNHKCLFISLSGKLFTFLTLTEMPHPLPSFIKTCEFRNNPFERSAIGAARCVVQERIAHIWKCFFQTYKCSLPHGQQISSPRLLAVNSYYHQDAFQPYQSYPHQTRDKTSSFTLTFIKVRCEQRFTSHSFTSPTYSIFAAHPLQSRSIGEIRGSRIQGSEKACHVLDFFCTVAVGCSLVYAHY